MVTVPRMVIIKPASKSYLSQNVNASSERCLSMNRISKPLQKKICDLSTLNILENTLRNILNILKVLENTLKKSLMDWQRMKTRTRANRTKLPFESDGVFLFGAKLGIIFDH